LNLRPSGYELDDRRDTEIQTGAHHAVETLGEPDLIPTFGGNQCIGAIPLDDRQAGQNDLPFAAFLYEPALPVPRWTGQPRHTDPASNAFAWRACPCTFCSLRSCRATQDGHGVFCSRSASGRNKELAAPIGSRCATASAGSGAGTAIPLESSFTTQPSGVATSSGCRSAARRQPWQHQREVARFEAAATTLL
jgi:hypothetical protein